jgi:cytochrome c-type biogenesis protein CcsB
MHVILLRVALAFYTIGLLHSVVTVLRRRYALVGVGLAAVILGCLTEILSLILRARELNTMPLTQRYEAFAFLAAVGALGYLIAYARYRIKSLSVFVFPALFLLTFLANVAYDPSDVIPASLQSNWIYIHTPLIFLGYAALFLSFAAAIMYLIQERELKTKHHQSIVPLPSLQVCDDLSYRALAIGFPLITLGLVSGALWAQSAWGTLWGGDLKILLSLVTWGIYLLLIHYRFIAGWQGKRAAWMAIAGFVGVLISFLGASYFGGLHSFTP